MNSCKAHVTPYFIPTEVVCYLLHWTCRAHVDVLLQVVCTDSTSSSTANGTAAAANGTTNNNVSNKQQQVVSASVIQAAVQQLSSQLFGNLQQLVFVLDQLNTSAASSTAKQQTQPLQLPLVTSTSTAPLQDLVSSSGNRSDPCISLKPLQHTSSSSSSSPPPAPMFEFTPSSTKQQQQQLLSLTISLDVLCYAPSSSPLSALHTSLLVPALQQQLQAVQQELLQQAAAGQALCPVKALHFKPPVLGFPVTLCYSVPAGPQEAAESALLPRRQQLHTLLGLPNNVPMLRFANALTWGAAAAAEGPDAAVKAVRLSNVHDGLSPPGGCISLSVVGALWTSIQVAGL